MGINNLSHEKLVNLIDDGDNQEVFDEIRSRFRELENLKCCGNCINHRILNINIFCEVTGEQINGHKACLKWYPDGLTIFRRVNKEGR
jgi:hypothetical protein